MEISEKNPEGCRPLVQYPWHANGPPSETPINTSVNILGGNVLTQASNTSFSEDIEKVHEVWCKYSELVKHDSNTMGNMIVIH